jgi:CelD/BcsL family acetyltransferase involved in cellulose biosynthesis
MNICEHAPKANLRSVVEEITTIGELEEFEQEWRSLYDADPLATPFQSPEWLLPWVRHIWGGGELRVLVVRREGIPVGCAPLFAWGAGNIRLAFLGAGISDYTGMLTRPEYARESACAVLDHLARSGAPWEVCDFEDLAPWDPLLESQKPESLHVHVEEGNVCPVVKLPDSMGGVFKRLTPKFSRSLRLGHNRLQGIAWEFVMAGPSDWEEILAAFFRLHAARWRERGETGVVAEESLQAFHREVAGRFLERGWLRLEGLRVKGALIGVQYGFADKNRYYAYLGGFDPAWGRSSPGSLLLEESFRDAISAGLREFDFLRNREPYKYEWGAEDRANRRMRVTRAAAAREFA